MRQDWIDLYESHGDALVLYALQFTGCRADAEDVVQEAFVRLFASESPGLRQHENPKAILFQAVRWRALDDGRKKQRRLKREKSLSEDACDLVLAATEPESRPDFSRRVAEALGSLSQEQREVVVLHIWSGFTFVEIGKHLGISANTAASRYRYALGNLRNRCGELRSFFDETVSCSKLE